MACTIQEFLWLRHQIAWGVAHLHGGNSGASLIAGWAGQPNVTRKVQMVTFDSVADLHKHSPFVVIDVEGHELPVLEGMVQHLQSWTSALLMVEITSDQKSSLWHKPK